MIEILHAMHHVAVLGAAGRRPVRRHFAILHGIT
jgi:hypothetical protein